MINGAIAALADYAIEQGLIEKSDRVWAINGILSLMKVDSYEEPQSVEKMDLEDILKVLLDDAQARGVIGEGITERDIFDTRLMGVLTPRPSAVIAKFNELYEQSPKLASDWYYHISRSSDYIRTYRVKKDLKWKAETEYGELDITINLSKPEKDPKAIAAARLAKQGGYPKCLLCREAEGYAGRLDYPSRANHRLIPLNLAGDDYFMQYSPYVYYNEHCIILNANHTPMKIDKGTFAHLLDFVDIFPHYFLGSNADLPIVGGSILSHDHFQGGSYCFAMEQAPVETELSFKGFDNVRAGIVKWPMSVIRLSCTEKAPLIELADKILKAWRGYTDESVNIFAETDGEPHNTITPIARRRGTDFELDLVLRNNLTTEEFPLGLFHPHQELHHIKKENIGLIEVMGLAVLPARLKEEMNILADALISGKDVRAVESIEKHADWVDELKKKYTFTAENTVEILRLEIGKVFMLVLEDAGVYKRDEKGQAAFIRFAQSV